MKLGDHAGARAEGRALELDETDRRILAELQADCKAPLAQVGKRVGLSAPSVMERIRKLEEAGVVRGYHAQLDSRAVGLDVTSFIGVSMSPQGILDFEAKLEDLEEVQECHHVTGAYTMLLKVKTQNTQTLEGLISRLRFMDGVIRTETLVVLSTRLERVQVPLGINAGDPPPVRRPERAAKENKVAE
jgi:Lrp/AsnC family leucine-responsive transcriptional regulator